jgi:hypothetical protein
MLSRLFGHKRTTLLTLTEDFPEITKWKEFIILHNKHKISNNKKQDTQHNTLKPLKGKVFKSHKQFLKEIEKNIDKTIKQKVNSLKDVKKTRPKRHNFTPEETHKDYLDTFHNKIKEIHDHSKTESSILELIWQGKLNNNILELKTHYKKDNNDHYIKLRLQKHD